jgi:hypothetical protein
MATVSGKYGQVDVGSSTFTECNHWTMEIVVDASQFGTFGGGGDKTGNVGQRSATGTIEGPYDLANPVEQDITAGSSVTLVLYLSTAAGGEARSYTLTAQITSLSFEVEGDTGEKVSWSANFQSSGAITPPTE